MAVARRPSGGEHLVVHLLEAAADPIPGMRRAHALPARMGQLVTSAWGVDELEADPGHGVLVVDRDEEDDTLVLR